MIVDDELRGRGDVKGGLGQYKITSDIASHNASRTSSRRMNYSSSNDETSYLVDTSDTSAST
jgi:hypothetical protein